MGVGNPAACKTVKRYLVDARQEQLKARVTPRQAEPVLLSDLHVIARHIQQRLQGAGLSPLQIFVLARDQAFFKALLFAGDRAADLLLVNTAEICPVAGIEQYFQICSLLGIRLTPGCLLRSVSKTGKVASSSLQPAAAQARLDTYVGKLHGLLSGTRLTLHGFRSGSAVSMALADVGLHDIMDHVGWRTSKTALHYIKLRQVLNPAGPAARLAELDMDTGLAYKNLNTLKDFVPAFPE